jgi:hypothetical protein
VPDATSGTTGRIALTGREPIIDAEPNTIEETDSPHLARATSAQPRMLRALLDHTRERSGLGQRRVFKRAPLSTSDIVPEGTRFIEGTHSNPAGSRACRLSSPPAVIRGSRFLWSSCYMAAPSHPTISPPARG